MEVQFQAFLNTAVLDGVSPTAVSPGEMGHSSVPNGLGVVWASRVGLKWWKSEKGLPLPGIEPQLSSALPVFILSYPDSSITS